MEKSETTENADNSLPFPWVKDETIKIEKSLIGDVFPIVESDLRCRSTPIMEFKLPKYDWKEEDERLKKSQPPPSENSQNGPVFIPNTRILQENAYSFRFHLRSTAMLVVYIILLVVLAKKLVHAVVLLIDSLVE